MSEFTNIPMSDLSVDVMRDVLHSGSGNCKYRQNASWFVPLWFADVLRDFGIDSAEKWYDFVIKENDERVGELFDSLEIGYRDGAGIKVEVEEPNA